MYLSISAHYTLKDRPKGYRGLAGEHISYSKDNSSSFEHLAYAVVRDILGYYIMFEDADVLNASLNRLREGLSDLCVVQDTPADYVTATIGE